jgi:GNAT superfamily N-acetyltransferase
VAEIEVREAVHADLPQIAAVALATGQDEEWGGADPAYMTHLLAHGRVVVGVAGGSVAGFGATRAVGSGPGAVSMLCDLFVHPEVHGSGCGRAMLAALWPGTGGRRMTFSSLHTHALPLYTSFGLDAWWPLLYLRGRVDALAAPAGWQSAPAPPASVAAAELAWTGADRSAEHQAWARRPGGAGVLAEALA